MLCTELSLYFVINLKFALANFYLNLSPVAKDFTAMPSTFKLTALPFAVAHSIFLLRLAPYDRGDIILAHNAFLVGFKESVELPVLVNIHPLTVGEKEGVARDVYVP